MVRLHRGYFSALYGHIAAWGTSAHDSQTRAAFGAGLEEKRTADSYAGVAARGQARTWQWLDLEKVGSSNHSAHLSDAHLFR